MSRKIPFSLKMVDGAAVRTIEELREHFDLAAVLSYYEDGRLTEWLTDRYYEEEADKVRALGKSSENLNKSLCEILGVPYSENEGDQLDIGDIAKSNERRERLKQFTADDAILAVADRVAFTQDELECLLNKGVKGIYLCGDGESFTIPGSIGSITYIGINNPMVQLDGEIVESDIDFQSLELNIGNNIDSNNFFRFFDKAPEVGVKQLQLVAEKGYAETQYALGECYKRGFGVKSNFQEAIKWYRKAAEQGHVEAQYELGIYYKNYSEKNFQLHMEDGDWEICKEAIKWCKMAAEQGHVEAQYELGQCYYYSVYGFDFPRIKRAFEDENINTREETVKWYRKAAEQGDMRAQYKLGFCYNVGIGVKRNVEEAMQWYQKAAEQGYVQAQYELGLRYDYGGDVKRNFQEAVKWYRKAAEQGDRNAQYELERHGIRM